MKIVSGRLKRAQNLKVELFARRSLWRHFETAVCLKKDSCVRTDIFLIIALFLRGNNRRKFSSKHINFV